MSIRLAELIDHLGGLLVGLGETLIDGIAPLKDASPSQISFLASPKLRQLASDTAAGALIISPKDHDSIGQSYAGPRILTDNPYAYYARTAQFFLAKNRIPQQVGIHPTASVDTRAKVSPKAYIGAFVTVEAGAVIEDDAVVEHGCFVGYDAFVGSGTYLHPNVTFKALSRIGRNGIVHSGAVIGTDGFGFANDAGAWIKIPQTGGVLIGDDVEIGSNTCIDRGALTDTIIGNGVKLDNQIQIGHNCQIGAHTAMAGCVGVAGSAIIGKYCTFGGAAMVTGHITIADHVHISAASMVSRSIHQAGVYTGFFPLSKNADWEKSAVIVRNLSKMREKIRDLEKTVKLLSEKTR